MLQQQEMAIRDTPVIGYQNLLNHELSRRNQYFKKPGTVNPESNNLKDYIF